jgi:hypothetical protein
VSRERGKVPLFTKAGRQLPESARAREKSKALKIATKKFGLLTR